MTELEFALNTFYLLMSGALVMWMAAGFTRLEAGLVRSKNAAEIVTKNFGLFSIACVMYLVCGFFIMYPGDSAVSAWVPGFSLGYLGLGMGDQDMSYGSYSEASDFFFQVVFVATAMSIVSGAVAERMKLLPFFAFACFVSSPMSFLIAYSASRFSFQFSKLLFPFFQRHAVSPKSKSKSFLSFSATFSEFRSETFAFSAAFRLAYS